MSRITSTEAATKMVEPVSAAEKCNYSRICGNAVTTTEVSRVNIS